MMNDGTGADKVGGDLHQDKKALTRAARPPRPEGCKWPFLVARTSGFRWQRCNRPKCSRRCRDVWGWKRAKCVCRSFLTLPPSHFATIHPQEGMTNATFCVALGKFMLALRRRVAGLAYLLVREWVRGVMHAHGLFRAERISQRAMRRVVREAKVVANVRASVKPARNPAGVAVYIFKAGRKKKAELPPQGYRGRLFTKSRDFLVTSFAVLWRAIQAERVAQDGN